MKLKKLLKEMKEAMSRYDLSDDYLKAHHAETRKIGEFSYGIASVPCDWVYPYLHALATDERLSDIVENVEMMIEEAQE